MQAFNKIREPDPTGTTTGRILVSTGISIFGFLIGIFQKWLDSMAVNELPELFQKLDLTNYFGRLAVWILIASAIAVCAKSPRRASLNCFLFFGCMLAGYYLYCQLVLGFLPVSYMMVWAGMAVASLPLAYVCWYAKGCGIPAIVISAGILGVLLAQAVLLVQGIMVTHVTEVITWLCALVLLRRPWKEFLAVIGLSVPVAAVYQLCIPYWG